MATPLINYRQPAASARRRVFIRDRDRLNYATFVDRFADLYGDRTAFVLDTPLDYPGFKGDTLSYRDVARLVNDLARALRDLGVKQGDRVGLITLNRVEMAFTNFACGKLGAIPVPMNFMLRPNEIEYIVQKAGIELLVVDPFVWSNTITDRSTVPSVKRWAMIGDEPAPDGIIALRDLMDGNGEHVTPVQPSSMEQVAVLFFTSGTTGFPKGAMLTHASTMIQIHNHGRLAALAPSVAERLALLVMPVAHAAGYALTLLNLALGTPCYFMSKFDPAEIFRLVEEVKPTIFSGTPAMYRMLLHAGAAEHDWSSIKIFGGGADVFDDELVSAVRDLGARPGGRRKRPWFIRGYGMAEANSYCTQTPPFEAGDACVGWVLPPVKYRLVDEDGQDVPRGTPGEMLIKGPNVTTGYWNDPDATASSIDAQGWFHTGDVLRQGKWRMLYFVGRSSDIIKSGGYKISANEIDTAMMGHPDVEASATVGIPHPLKGERPFTAVTLKRGSTTSPEELLAWARERIAAYKCPRAIIPIDAMPYTFSMKPKRIDVRERLLRELPEDLRTGG